MTEAYCDTNVYSPIGLEEAEQLRVALARAGIVLRLSIVDIEELLGQWTTERAAAVRRLQVARALVGFHGLLKQPRDILTEAIEAYAAGQPAPHVLLPEAERRHIVSYLVDVCGRSSRRDGVTAEIVVGVRAQKEEFHRIMLEGRDQAVADLRAWPAAKLRALTFEDYWAAGAVQWAEDFAEPLGEAAVEACRRRGLEGLLEVRTVRLAVGAMMSLVFSVVAGGAGQPTRREPRASDGYDQWHAILASTADVFVTGDQRLADHLKQVPGIEGFRVVPSLGALLESEAAVPR